MKKFLCLLCFLMIVRGATAQPVLIRDVTVIDVNSGKSIPKQSVIVRDGVIQLVGNSKTTKPPANSVIVEGNGKYLMPGMADAHIHFFQSGSLYTRPDIVDLRTKVPYEKEKTFGVNNASDYMRRYLRLGITSVIDVGGPFFNFAIRDSISKTTIAPNILVTGPLFSIVEDDYFGQDKPIEKIATQQEADLLFARMLPFRPDFIKIWYIADEDNPAEKNFPLVKYIAEQTHKKGLKLCVHATELVTAQMAVEAGADILVHSISDALIPDQLINTLKTKKITYIPTLLVGRNYYKALSGRLANHSNDLAFANSTAYGSLTDTEAMDSANMPMIVQMLRKTGIPASEDVADSISAINLVKLHRAGVNIAAGTDAGNIGTMHASSYIQELDAMANAGLTPAEVIKSATINVAIGFGKENEWGSMERGKKADLILLNKNPLERLENLLSLSLVFKDGRMLQPDSILNEGPEAVVQRQVNAYNARNIDAFMDTYSNDIELFNFPQKILSTGKTAMRKDYEKFFASVSNLYCEVEKRIVIGNKIIDKERVRAGDQIFHAVAVYEVENGKIRKVTFME